jgi:hypothetical protein
MFGQDCLMRILAVAAVIPTLVIPTVQGPQRSSVSTTLPSDPVEVPMRMVNRRPLVDVRINGGGPYTFLIDTGGSGTARADKSLVDKLKLEVVGEARVAMTVSGPMEISEAPLKGNVDIGRHEIAEPTLQFTPAMRRGNLGIGVLSEFTLTIDQQNQRIRFARRQRSGTAEAAPRLNTGQPVRRLVRPAVPATRSRGLHLVAAKVRGEAVAAR